MSKKKKVKQVTRLHLEGNKGGDYITLSQTMEQEKNDTCYLEVGHACVVYIRAVVPVEFITSLFAEFEVETVGKTLKDRILSRLPWDASFNEELVKKVDEECDCEIFRRN